MPQQFGQLDIPTFLLKLGDIGRGREFFKKAMALLLKGEKFLF